MRRVILLPVQAGGLARKDLNWSTPDTHLYSEALTGRARSIPRCTYCLQDDHSSQHCPQNPDQLWVTWHSGAAPWQGPSATLISRRSSELCRRFNEGRCRLAACRFSHACRGAHPAIACHQSHQWPPAPSLRAWSLH